MSNKRIDLTQFEEITKGTWEVTEPEYPHYGVIRIHPCSATVRRYQSDSKTEEAWYANAKAIAAVPDLIAELKRSYEEIDEVTKWKDHWKRTSQTWSKVVEIFDPKANNAELNDAINKAFGHDASE